LLSGLGQAGRPAIDALLGCREPDAAAAAAARGSAFASVVQALEVASTQRAALLVLDDLHWADDGTLQLLDFVAAHLPGVPVLVVGTYRDTDTGPGSALTRLGGRADQVLLRGLDPARVAALLGEQVGAGRGTELVEQVVRLTAGNPFLIIQIGRLLAEDPGALGREIFPTGARDLLRQRLDVLDSDARTVLTAAAVLGSPFRASDLEQLARRAATPIANALDRAAGLRITQRVSGTRTWAFAHDLFRQAALETSGPGERADLHRRAATVLQHREAEPAVIAAHLLAAGGPDAKTAVWCVRAGERAMAAFGWEEAAGHYGRALATVTGQDQDIRGEALAGLGRAQLLAGNQEAAARAFDELAVLARSMCSAELLAQAALGFSADLSGFEVRLFDQRQIDLLQEAARRLSPRASPALRAMVLARLSVALSLTAPDTRRLELAQAAVALARQAAEPTVLARALAAHCDAIAGPAHVRQRLTEASEIIDIAETEGDGPLELLGRRLRYVARLECGDLAGVEQDAKAFGRRADAIGNPLYAWYEPLWRAQFALVAGDIDNAARLVDHADTIARAAGSTNGPMLATVLRLLANWQRGDYAAAAHTLQSLEDVAPELTHYSSTIGGFAWAFVLTGQAHQATAILDRAFSVGLSHQMLDAEWLPNMTNLVRAAAALNHPILPEAISLLEPHAELVAFEGIGAGLYGSVARIIALGCATLGRQEDAVRYARIALRTNRAFGGILHADALRTLADCTSGDASATSEADALHAAADATYAALGAHHLTRQSPAVALTTTAGPLLNELRRDGEVWHLTYLGTTAIVKHSKGLADLAVLLARPGQYIHVTELAGVPPGMVAGSGGDALDRRAIAAYKHRLAQLTDERDTADANHDLRRAELARIEYDTLVAQLSSSLGLNGRTRAAGPEPAERLRKAVAARVRDTIRHLETIHPALAHHLHHAIRTGTHCAYQPPDPTTWQCQSGPSRRPGNNAAASR
jgi:hypothetical protein